MSIVTKEVRELSCILTNEELADASGMLAAKTLIVLNDLVAQLAPQNLIEGECQEVPPAV